MISLIALTLVLAIMLGELSLSRVNERRLRARGAVAVPDPVYPTMRWAYPAVFIVMTVEGTLGRSGIDSLVRTGIGVFAASKLLKAWAISSLGERWTYKVLVLPGIPLVSAGPYRFVRHPNYVAVVGELIGFVLITRAYVTGPLGLAFFSWLLQRRIRAEEQALR